MSSKSKVINKICDTLKDQAQKDGQEDPTLLLIELFRIVLIDLNRIADAIGN